MADGSGTLVEIKVRAQKNDQFGVGQIARVVALPSWGGACPVALVSGWLWLRGWIARCRDYAGRLAASGPEGPVFIGLARARFGLALAASGVSASRDTPFWG